MGTCAEFPTATAETAAVVSVEVRMETRHLTQLMVGQPDLFLFCVHCADLCTRETIKSIKFKSREYML